MRPLGERLGSGSNICGSRGCQRWLLRGYGRGSRLGRRSSRSFRRWLWRGYRRGSRLGRRSSRGFRRRFWRGHGRGSRLGRRSSRGFRHGSGTVATGAQDGGDDQDRQDCEPTDTKKRYGHFGCLPSCRAGIAGSETGSVVFERFSSGRVSISGCAVSVIPRRIGVVVATRLSFQSVEDTAPVTLLEPGIAQRCRMVSATGRQGCERVRPLLSTARPPNEKFAVQYTLAHPLGLEPIAHLSPDTVTQAGPATGSWAAAAAPLPPPASARG